MTNFLLGATLGALAGVCFVALWLSRPGYDSEWGFGPETLPPTSRDVVLQKIDDVERSFFPNTEPTTHT